VSSIIRSTPPGTNPDLGKRYGGLRSSTSVQVCAWIADSVLLSCALQVTNASGLSNMLDMWKHEEQNAIRCVSDCNHSIDCMLPPAAMQFFFSTARVSFPRHPFSEVSRVRFNQFLMWWYV